MVQKRYDRVSKSIYIGEELRKRLDSTVLDIGYHTGHPMTASIFLRHLINEFSDVARDKLKKIYSDPI